MEISMDGIGRYWADDYNRFSVPPFTVWHLATGFDNIALGDSPLVARVGVSVRNVGDRTYAASGWVNPDLDAVGQPIYLEPGLPRTIAASLGLRWKF
jgi:outer membrane receptor protein involved in Fe transport